MTRPEKVVTIANGASLSNAMYAGQGVPVLIYFPANFTGTSITFQGSFEGQTWFDLYNATGNEVNQIVAASRAVRLDAIELAGLTFLRVRAGSASVPTAQVADVQLTVVTRIEPR